MPTTVIRDNHARTRVVVAKPAKGGHFDGEARIERSLRTVCDNNELLAKPIQRG
jgi:hypothetical protein